MRGTLSKSIKVRVRARRGDEVVEGTLHDDGLQDLWPVDTEDGTKYISVLWTIEVWEVIPS